MSQRWDQVEERLDDYEAQLDSVYRLYHIPVVAALVAFMLWVRVRYYERYLVDGEVLFGGNDAWYHYRTTNYAVENFPFNLGYDPWTGFDVGNGAGQFGTLFDQLIAAAALIVGLGDPSQSTIDMTFLFAPAVFGALCAIPVFYVGKRLGGRFGGIVAVIILAMTPGAFLSRSVAGFTDHHVAETLFQAFSLLAVMVMVTVAQREKPIYELVEAREFDALRRPLLWGALAGVAISLHIWVWPPAVFFLGVFAIFLFVLLSLEYLRGHSPDHVAIPSVVAMLVVAVMTAFKMQTLELSATDFSLVQPLLAVLVALGAAFMAGVARIWDGTDLPRYGYPAAIVGTGGVLTGIAAVVSPETLGFFVNQLTRVAGLTATDTARTVGEVSSPWAVSDGPIAFFTNSYQFAFYTAIVGFGLLVYRIATAARPRGQQVLIVVWSLFTLLMTLTQIRFDYYFVVGVAAANAYLVHEIFRFVDLEDVREDVTNVKPYQVIVVVAVLFAVAGPMLAGGSAIQAANDSTAPGESQLWMDSLDWMEENTPKPGAYGSGDEPELDYYGNYPMVDDYEYDDGEYGVMSWWDYGHFITTMGERIPVANPFQQHAETAADFLLADEESEALEVLEEDVGEGESVQYVMVDYYLGTQGTRKYMAPTAWESRHDIDRVRAPELEQRLQQGRNEQVEVETVPELSTIVYAQGGQAQRFYTQRAFETMRVHLYQHHGSAVEASTRVYNFQEYNEEEGWGVLATRQQEGENGQTRTVADVDRYDTPAAASAAAANDSMARQGGLNAPSERVDALEHFRTVYMSEAPQTSSRSWVKTFERVEGATIQGTGPANTEVQAAVSMESNATGQSFVYRQYAQTDENGNFEMVVPYSTTGYDEYGVEEGYTDVDVRANSSYQFGARTNETAYVGTADVTEGQVLGEEDGPVEVDLEQIEAPQNVSVNPAGGNGGTATADSTGSETTGGSSGSGGSAGSVESAGSTGSGGSTGANEQLRPVARTP